MATGIKVLVLAVIIGIGSTIFRDFVIDFGGAQASLLVGPVGVFTNFVQIAVLLLAWAIVLLAFFIIAIQLFVTLIEFKLTTLAGFVLVPFGLFGRTALGRRTVIILGDGVAARRPGSEGAFNPHSIAEPDRPC